MKNSIVAICFSVLAAVNAGAAEPVDSLSLPTERTDWIDPVRATPVNTEYVLFPTPSRGEDTKASCMVFLPEGYDPDGADRYPVIYYLHGGTGNQREGRWLINIVDQAVKDGKMKPVIIVCPQALPIGWYINANESDPKVLSGPIEDVMIRDLIPYIDSHYKTIASPEGRGVEGFSMGGRGALALAFNHPDMFGVVSSVAGAVVDWDEEPLQRALECTFGDVNDPFSRIYFEAWHPKLSACRNARQIIRNGMKVRMFVGDRDRLFIENGKNITGRFHELLERLGIPHSYTVVPGADHNPAEIFDESVNPYDTGFWDDAFSPAVAATYVPRQIAEFVNLNFPKETVADLHVISDERGDHYLVTLGNGTSIKFNEHYNWILAVCPDGGVEIPETLMIDGIREYLHSSSQMSPVVRIEKVPRLGYDVRFADGSSLVFDTKGALVEG